MNHLLLFRHAAAAPADPAEVARVGVDRADARRALTPKGRRRFRRFVARLAAAEVRLDRLLHSPLRRAVETAELLHPLGGRTEVCLALAAPPGPELVAALGGERVAVVGHEPWLGELLTRLTGAPPGLVRWRKGGLVHLEREGADAPWRIRAVGAPGRSDGWRRRTRGT